VVLSGIDTKSNKKEENCEKIILLLLNKILSSHTSESNQQSRMDISPEVDAVHFVYQFVPGYYVF